MNSKLEPILFLKKDNHFNDSIDRSLVNEYTNKSCSEIILEIINNAFIIILPILSIFFTELTNILIFSYDKNEKSLDYTYLSNFIVIQTYYFFFGYIFFLGAMKYFESFINYDKREFKIKQVYYSFSRIFYFFSAFLIIMPLCLCSYFILKELYTEDQQNAVFWEFYRNYIIYLPLIFYANINFHLNLQTLKNTKSFLYLFACNLLAYLVILYVNSYFINSKVIQITFSLLINSYFNLFLSHFEVKRNIVFLSSIDFWIFEDLKLMKWESFYNFIKYSAFKGFLFNFRYFGLAILIYSSFYLGNNHLLATSFALSVMLFPHLFSLGVSKFYKSYLENSVFDHSQNTKAKYLRYFWLVITASAFLFTLLILLFKAAIFRIFFNLYQGFFYPVNFQVDPNIYEIYILYDKIIKFYSIFFIFDSIGNALQEILKAYNDHARNFLSFYKGASLVIFFFPLGLFIANMLEYEIYWGFWIAIYLQLIIYSLVLFIIHFRNYKNSTFLCC